MTCEHTLTGYGSVYVSVLGVWDFIPTTSNSKSTGYMLHHQFNIQRLYALPTLYLCVLYLSENKQRLVPLPV